jgi:hypothetical protein
MEKTNQLLQQVLKTTRILFFAILIMGSLFCFWGLNFFVLNDPEQGIHLGVYIMFSVMAFLSFIYGIRFVKNYSTTKKTQILKYPYQRRKETLIAITAVQLLLVEFVCIIGIFLAIFVQKREIIYPFYLLFLVGLYFSYPKSDWYKEYTEIEIE